MADPEHFRILKEEGVKAWNQWRRDNSGVIPDLAGAFLMDIDLTGVNLQKANLLGANISKSNLLGASLLQANLSGSDLTKTDLTGTSLSGSILRGTRLTYAGLIGATLEKADLRGSVLTGTVLTRADFTRAVFTDARMETTTFGNVDLSTAIDLEYVRHEYTSTIGTDTLALTLRNSGGKFTDEQIAFFEGAGVPPLLLEYLPSIMESNPLQFYSCFISYSTGDEEFADKLNEDLKSQGISTWKWNLDAVAGRYMRDNIDIAIRNYDKLILVCSADSLASGQVETEIRRALQKEQQIKKANEERRREAIAAGQTPPHVDANVLVPIRIDDSVFEWDSHIAADVTEYYIPDFTNAEPGSEKYRQELQKLIQALNPQTWPPKPMRPSQ